MNPREKALILSNKYQNDTIESKDELKAEINKYHTTLGMPIDKAKKSVEANICDELESNTKKPEVAGKDKLIKNISNSKQWVNAVVRVRELWDKNHRNLEYVGVLEDKTGCIKFTLWNQAIEHINANTNQPLLERGNSYYIKDMITKEFNGRIELKICKESTIIELSNEVSVGKETITGSIVDTHDVRATGINCPKTDCVSIARLNETPSENGIICDNHGEIGPITLSDLNLITRIRIANENESKDIVLSDKLLKETILQDHQNSIFEERELHGDDLSKNAGLIEVDGENIPEIKSEINELIGKKITATIVSYENKNPQMIDYKKEDDERDIDNIIVEARELQTAVNNALS